jgi:hypothetical protein
VAIPARPQEEGLLNGGFDDTIDVLSHLLIAEIKESLKPPLPIIQIRGNGFLREPPPCGLLQRVSQVWTRYH